MSSSINKTFTVNSDCQEERILARRERIEDRTSQKQEQPDKGLVAVTQSAKVPSIAQNTAPQTIEDCKKSLEDLKVQGENLLSDVRIAAQNHESKRRREQERQRRETLERLEAEARQEEEKFKEIFNRWDLKNSNCTTPQDYHSLLSDQTKSCAAVIHQKNKIIEQLKEAGRQADDKYVKDLKRQNKDVELIGKRMEQHVKEMTGKFQESLKKVESSLLTDRNETASGALNKSENAWKARALREIEMVYEHLEETDKYTHELDEIRLKGAEEYAIIKDKLERDVATHEQQLQQMKAIYQLNQEKLVYNHEILRNRDDENNIIKAQQKRKITKLQDNLNIQRQKLIKQEQQHKNEASNLSEDYQRIVTLHNELEQKRQHFTNSDRKRFHEIWKMNFNTVKNLAAQCLLADRIIHRQQLGLKWIKNDEQLWFCPEDLEELAHAVNSNTSTLSNDPVLAPWQEASLKKPLKDTIRDSTVDHEALPTDADELDKFSNRLSKNSKLSMATVRTLLPLLAEEGDFLFEQKLSTLLSTLESSHSTLIKLDAIFSALGIQTKEDLTTLTEELSVKLGDHNMDINKIVPALKEYLLTHSKGADSMASNQQATSKTSELTGKEWAALDKKYWNEIADIINGKKVKLWDGLEAGLEKYYGVLKQRSKLIVETDSLKQQNAELRLLLQQYLSSKVNKELKVPPTRVLQSELKD